MSSQLFPSDVDFLSSHYTPFCVNKRGCFIWHFSSASSLYCLKGKGCTGFTQMVEILNGNNPPQLDTNNGLACVLYLLCGLEQLKGAGKPWEWSLLISADLGNRVWLLVVMSVKEHSSKFYNVCFEHIANLTQGWHCNSNLFHVLPFRITWLERLLWLFSKSLKGKGTLPTPYLELSDCKCLVKMADVNIGRVM